MLRVILAFLLCFSALPGLAQAPQSSQTCEVLNRVAELPTALSAVQSGQLTPSAFQRRMEAAQSGLWAAHTVLANDPDDIAALWAVIHGVKEAGGTGIAIPRERHDQLISIFGKFGCQPTLLLGTGLIFGIVPMSFAIALAAFIGLGALLSASGFVRLRRRRRAVRHMCHLPALLRYDGTCTATTVVDIGRGGAKVKVPAGGFGTTEVTLHMTRLSVPARVRWENRMYAGLSFLAVQDEAAIRALLAHGETGNHLRDPTDAVPPCFAPGCHLSCGTHRAAHLSLAKHTA